MGTERANTAVTVRPARRDDVAVLVELVRELAVYERAPEEVELDEHRLAATLFRAAPEVFARVAELDGAIVGMAIFFRNYSTWTGRPGLYLEDLYVQPAHRRNGVGRALLGELARVAVAHGCARLEWSVLDWNAPAIAFYESIGAASRDGWTLYRISGAQLAELAAR